MTPEEKEELLRHYICSKCLYPYIPEVDEPGQRICPRCGGEYQYSARELFDDYEDMRIIRAYLPQLAKTVRNIHEKYEQHRSLIADGLDLEWWPDKSQEELFEKLFKAFETAFLEDMDWWKKR